MHLLGSKYKGMKRHHVERVPPDPVHSHSDPFSRGNGCFLFLVFASRELHQQSSTYTLYILPWSFIIIITQIVANSPLFYTLSLFT